MDETVHFRFGKRLTYVSISLCMTNCPKRGVIRLTWLVF